MLIEMPSGQWVNNEKIVRVFVAHPNKLLPSMSDSKLECCAGVEIELTTGSIVRAIDNDTLEEAGKSLPQIVETLQAKRGR